MKITFTFARVIRMMNRDYINHLFRCKLLQKKWFADE